MRTKVFFNNKPSSRKAMLERLGIKEYVQVLRVAWNERNNPEVDGVFTDEGFLSFSFSHINPHTPVHLDSDKGILYHNKKWERQPEAVFPQHKRSK